MSYLHWQAQARSLLEPLVALMQTGRASLPIAGNASNHDAAADRLESFARPLILAALYLQSVPESGSETFRGKVAGWFRAGLVLGTDPDSPEYWGPDANYHQHHVEMGLMAIGLQLAFAQLWTPLDQTDRDHIARWFATARGGGIVNNNHLFMSVHILEFLRTIGHDRPHDLTVIDTHLKQLETMHRGGGWFEDGINQAYDHYNAYAFHFYGLMWSHLHGQHATARAARWRGWARSFLDDYQHFFAASGEHPAFGRSITYRFNAIAPFGLAALEDCTDLPAGLLRRLCTRNLDFFLSKPIRNSQGCLAPGFTDVFPAMVEGYSCAASGYWCAKGFTPLLLPPTHVFWTAPEVLLPAERGFVRTMREPGLVARSLPDGEVELLNAGSMVSNTQLHYGAWKWSKIAYRTGTGFTYAFPEPTAWSPDGALLQTTDDGRIFGRHSTVTLELADDHLAFTTNLGAKAGQINTNVETHVFWHHGWLLHLHHYDASQPVRMQLGGFALPLTSPDAQLYSTDTMLGAWSSDHQHGTALQFIGGTPVTSKWDNRLDDTSARRHTHATYHATPVFQTARHEGKGWIAALSWTGRDRHAARPWKIERTDTGQWELRHPQHGPWVITHDALPLSPLNPQPVNA